MDIAQHTVTILRPSEGFRLYNSKKHLVASSIYLTSSEDAKDWEEIPEDEAENIVREQEQEAISLTNMQHG